LPTRRRARRPHRSLYGTLLRLWQALNPPEWLEGPLLWCLNARYLIGVTGLVWDERGRLLLVRQTYVPPPGWGLPGGWLEAGEGLEACARRELREELGYEVVVGPLAGWAELHPPRQYTFAFECRVLGGTFRPNAEISEIAYFPPDEALRLIRPRLRPLLEDILRRRTAEQDT
jgi:ADP-ribose pyrophosphatase YjhB (NUDIX family)